MRHIFSTKSQRSPGEKRIIFAVLLMCLIGIPTYPTQAQDGAGSHQRAAIIPGQAVVQLALSRQSSGGGLAKQAAATASKVLNQAMGEAGLAAYEPLFSDKLLSGLRNGDRLAAYYIVSYDEQRSFRHVSASLTRYPEIRSVEPVTTLDLMLVPNDERFASQSHLPQISAPSAWEISTGDSTVIIAVIDNGFDMEHTDLLANYAVNQAEAGGLTGVDDDGNGLIDDIRGYDFYHDDADPSFGPAALSGYKHGTHVAGISAAVGNNGIGTTGVTWNSRILPIKASSDSDPKHVSSIYGLRGIVYAVSRGAAVVNLSWGGTGAFSQAAQEVIQVAYENGTVIVAAAGNRHGDEPFYPASYHRVLSVAWVDGNDRKANGATFGASVDIASPGSAVLSSVPHDLYQGMSGSSMSAPMVSGAVALLSGLHPDWSASEIIRRIVFSADPIDDKNPQYFNQLGNGRLNLAKALSGSGLHPAPAKLVLESTTFSDAIFGNGDWLVEPGETVSVLPSFRNVALGSSPSVTFELIPLNNDLVDIEVGTMIAPVPGDTALVLPEAFVFSMSDSFAAGKARFLLRYQGENLVAGEDTLSLQVGRMPVLLVDDDDGHNNVEGFYGGPLEAMDIPYYHWDYERMGPPSAQTLSQFPAVVWLSEWNFPSLTSVDRHVLTDYLNRGGNLFLSGQDVGWDLVATGSQNASAESRDFYTTYLKARFLSDDAGMSAVTGVAEDPIAGGLSFDIFQPGVKESFQFPDVIEAVSPAQGIFKYAGSDQTAGIQYAGDYRLVYFGFGLEAINGSFDANPQSIDSTRSQVLSRVLNYLHPIRFTAPSDLYEQADILPLVLTYSGPGPQPAAIRLHYLRPYDSEYQELPLERSGEEYTIDLNVDQVAGPVHYFFAVSDVNFTWTYPVAGAANPLTVHIGADSLPPSIQINPIGNRLDLQESYSIMANIRDDTSLDTTGIYLHFSKGQAHQDSVKLTYERDLGLFAGTMAAEFAYGDTITYWIRARDRAWPANSSSSTMHHFIIGEDDFESGLGQWIFDPGVWGTDITQARSGQFSLTTFPGTSYPVNVDAWIQTAVPLDLSGVSQISLTFSNQFAMENGDMGFVELRVGEDGPWQVIGGPYSGLQNDWSETTIDLLPFVGQSACFIRFRFISDGTTGSAMPGWSVDHLRIQGHRFSTDVAVLEQGPKVFHLWPSYPNPVRSRTEITLDLPRAETVVVSLYNLLGQRVRTLHQGPLNPGRSTWTWAGRDESRAALPAGVYFLEVVSERHKAVQKLLLIR